MDAATVTRELLEAVFPERCPLCGVGVEAPGPCPGHSIEVDEESARCGRCATRLARELPDGFRCDSCARRPPQFRRTLVLGDYGADLPLREWILALKHRGRPDLALPLGAALARVLERRLSKEEPEYRPLLCPVPLHYLRRLERGYDQARLLARAVAGASGLPLVRGLRRRCWTAPQGAPGTSSRTANVAGVFRARRTRALLGREVWLVDDVLTSGATASECARVLRRAGAARVGVLALARAAGVRRVRL